MNGVVFFIELDKCFGVDNWFMLKHLELEIGVIKMKIIYANLINYKINIFQPIFIPNLYKIVDFIK